MAAALKDFLDRAESHGIYPEVLGGLNLKHSSPSGPPFDLGVVTKGGVVDTWPAAYWQRTRAGKAYNEALAELIGGEVREKSDGQSSLYTATGKMPRLSDFLPRHAEAWLAAIDRYVAALSTNEDFGARDWLAADSHSDDGV